MFMRKIEGVLGDSLADLVSSPSVDSLALEDMRKISDHWGFLI
jgi:hypothetical protein